MTFLNPLAFLFASLAIPIVLLYMLRLRRREVLVSSHFLWQRLLRDHSANTPWQKLQRNLLLVLQLLFLALLVLALARPAISVATTTNGRVAVLLDASASMNANNADGQTRWQIAQGKALDLVAQMGVGDEMTVIRVGDYAQPLTEYTNDVVLLRQVIRNAQVGQGGADWDTALTLAAGGARTADAFSIQIISDGSAGTLSREVLPANIPQPTFIAVGDAHDNLAITALAVRTANDGQPQLFAQVQHYGVQDVTFSLTVRLDGVLWVSQEATVGADRSRAFVFAIDQPFTTVQASLVYPDTVSDYLALDNSAWAVSDSALSRRALMISTTDNRFIAQALSTLPNVTLYKGDATRNSLPTQPYDFYIFDGYLPSSLPDADMLIINPPRSTALYTLGAFSTDTTDLTIQEPTHPLMQYVNVQAVNLRQVRAVQSDVLDALITTTGGAMLLAGEADGRQVVLLPFDLADSDFPLQIAYPIFMANVLEWFTPSNRLTTHVQYHVGDSVKWSLPATANQARVTLPNGSSVVLERDDVFNDTQALGLYAVDALQDGQALFTQALAVNLFDAHESNITPLTDLPLSGGAALAPTLEQQGLRELWGVFAWLALAVLLLEWWLYHRQFQLRMAR